MNAVREAAVGWSVPGYALSEVVGFGVLAESWLARDIGTGEPVLLQRLGPGRDLREVRARTAELRGLTGPHVQALRDVVAGSDGEPVLVVDPAPGGELATVLAVRGWLDPGEVTTVGIALADGLAELHRRGLVHGALTAGTVAFSTEGRPLLADLALVRLAAGEQRTAGAAGDVHALGVLLAGAAADDEAPGAGPGAAPGAALAAALKGALDADPVRWPTAVALAASLRAAGVRPLPVRLVCRARVAAPVGGSVVSEIPVSPPVGASAPDALPEVLPEVLPEPVPEPVPERVPEPVPEPVPEALGRVAFDGVLPSPLPRRRPARRLLVGAVLIVVGLLAVGVAVAGSDRGGVPTASPSLPGSSAVASQSAPAVVPVDPAFWRAVFATLDTRRSRAYATDTLALLGQVYAPGSPALATDLSTLRRFAAEHVDVVGLRVEVMSLRVLEVRPGSATVQVVETLAPYELVRAGQLLNHSGRQAAVTYRVGLVPAVGEAGGWRIATVSAVLGGAQTRAPSAASTSG